MERADLDRTELPAGPEAAYLDPELESKAMQLMEIGGFSLVSCRLALRRNRGIVAAAAEWLFDSSNQPAILAAELEGGMQRVGSLERGDSSEIAEGDEPMPLSPVKDCLSRTLSKAPSASTLGFSRKSSASLLGKRDLLVEEDGAGPLAAEYALTLYAGNIALARAWLKDAANAEMCANIEIGAAVSDDMVDPSEGTMPLVPSPSTFFFE